MANPKVFPGNRCEANIGAISWSKNFVAYGCQCYVVIINASTLEIVQTLDEHHFPVTSVKWAPQFHTAPINQSSLVLASADTSGTIFIWNGFDGNITSTLRDVNSPADMIEWYPESDNLLLSLHHHNNTSSGGGQLVMWDVKESTQLWSVPVADLTLGISLNFSPFDPTFLSFASASGLVYFVEDLAVASPPASKKIESKYKIGNNQQSSQSNSSQQSSSSSSSSSSSGSQSLQSISRKIGRRDASSASGAASNTSSMTSTMTSEDLQLYSTENRSFRGLEVSPHLRNIVFFLMAREIIVFDFELGRAVGSTRLENSIEPFSALRVIKNDPELLACLHDDGSVSMWHRRSNAGPGGLVNDAFEFEMCAFTPAAQIQKKGHKRMVPSSLVVSPVDFRRFITVSMEGVLLEWDFAKKTKDESSTESGHKDQSGVYDLYLIKRLNRTGKLSIASELESLRPGTCVAVCPEQVDRTYYAAVGTATGIVQIVDLLNFRVKRAVQVAEEPITAVAWANERKVVVCSGKQLDKSKGKFVSSLAVVDANSCEISVLKAKKETLGLMRLVKVSPKKQYLAVAYGQFIDVWDFKAMSFIRTVRHEQNISSIEWIPTPQNAKKTFDDLDEYSESRQYVPEEIAVVTSSELTGSFLSASLLVSSQLSAIRFVSVTNRGVSIVQNELFRYNPNVTCLKSISNEFVACGDFHGNITLINTKTYETKSTQVHKGSPISGMELSPSGNLLLTRYQNGEFAVWDLVHLTRKSGSHYLTQRGIAMVGFAWANENPVVLSSDGALRILDQSLAVSTSRVRFESFETPLLNPNVISGDSLILKSLLLSSNKIGDKYTEEHKAFLSKYADPCVLESIKGLSTMDACLEIARYYESTHEVRFWELVKESIKKYKLSPKGKEGKEEEEEAGSPAEDAGKVDPDNKYKSAQFYDNFTSFSEIKHFEEEVETNHMKSFRNSTALPSATKHYITTTGIATSKPDDVINVLLMPTQGKTQSKQQSQQQPQQQQQQSLDYESALKACLVAATVNPTTFVNTTKMVAIKLISEGSLQEGVQLLMIIGKGFEGCKHLISQGKWTQAAWLASLLLEEKDRAAVLSMWASYLVESGLRTKAIEVLLALGDFHQVLFLLNGAKDWELAYMLVTCLEEEGIIRETEDVDNPVVLGVEDVCSSTRRLSVTAGMPPVHLIVNLVKESYAQYLNSVVGLKEFSS